MFEVNNVHMKYVCYVAEEETCGTLKDKICAVF
jgi:hypothetical protein